MNLEFFSAPLALQLALGGGYLGYLAAYAGIRAHHRQIDIAFLTVAFGITATTCFEIAQPKTGDAPAIAIALLLVVLVGLAWRGFGRRIIRRALQRGQLSYADDDPSVLTAVFADTSHNVSQVMVVLDDGRELRCDDTSKFSDAAIAPFIYGSDGSIALYVTHSSRLEKDGTQKEEERQENVRDPVWGDNMTIVPAGRVRHVDIRFKKRG
ncbi:hypothetical protein [Stappia sp. 28M-7]|uniref:hypothetical protein n=1 Tax=Stappia sp. 28M-7 TaxID=2762596 RepID=UPI00163CD84A|nr:hypothetical protein [Stappia sp. 28M-7]MBC2858730.1 hypothetical protein [Stappia sp. 28M-7]